MVSSQDQAEAFSTLGTDAAGGVSLAGPSRALDEFQAAVTGTDAPAPVPLPQELTDKLETLETEGAKELIALGEDAVLQQVVGHAVTSLADLGGERVKQAFVWVKEKVNFVRRAAVRILEWVVDKFKSLVPKEHRDKVDKAVKFVTEKLRDGAVTLAGDLLGMLLGRPGAEEAWQGKDPTAAKAGLETVISGHIKRIGYVSTGRKAVAGAAAVVEAVLSIAAAHVQIVLGALAAVLAGFVCWQVWDGFNDIERLASAV